MMDLTNVKALPGIVLGTTQPPRRRTQRRRDPVADVMAMVELRDHCRAVAAERQRLQQQRASWRPVIGKLIVLGLVAAVAFVVVSHAMAQ